jgi:hypothetical protein
MGAQMSSVGIENDGNSGNPEEIRQHSSPQVASIAGHWDITALRPYAHPTRQKQGIIEQMDNEKQRKAVNPWSLLSVY